MANNATVRVTGEGPKSPLEFAQAGAEFERGQLALVQQSRDQLEAKVKDGLAHPVKLKSAEAIVAEHKARTKAAEKALDEELAAASEED